MKITRDFLRTVIRESLEGMGTVDEAALAGKGVYILLDENNFIRGAYINNDRGFKYVKAAVDELKKDGVQIRVYSCPFDSIQEPNEVDMVYDTGGSDRY
jgi:hypothetical protein